MFELNEENVKKILLIITYTLILAFCLFNFEGALNVFGFLFNLLSPFIFGLCFAFIANIFMIRIEKSITTPQSKKEETRILSIGLSVAILVGIVLLTIGLFIPQMINAIHLLVNNLPGVEHTIKDWLSIFFQGSPKILQHIQAFSPNWNEIAGSIGKFIGDNFLGLSGNPIQHITNMVVFVVNIILGVVLSVVMLYHKETLLDTTEHYLKKHTPKKTFKQIEKIGKLTNTKFQKYFEGQFTEALALAVLTFVCMLITGMPYSLAISIFVGVFSLIPVIGILFAMLIGVILIFAVSPIRSLWFIILMILVQQIEGNFIKPKIVHKTIALPSIISFAAIVIGGNNFGILGLLISVPIASVLYDLYKDFQEKKHHDE